jgi:hypothetical protein
MFVKAFMKSLWKSQYKPQSIQWHIIKKFPAGEKSWGNMITMVAIPWNEYYDKCVYVKVCVKTRMISTESHQIPKSIFEEHST